MTHQIIAFGGWLYPVSKWLPSFVRHYASPILGFSFSWCRDFARTLNKPTILIGFSAGATAAMHVAGHSPMVTEAIVHSCEHGNYQVNYHCEYRLFITDGDTTPTQAGTRETFRQLAAAAATADLNVLPFVPFAAPTFFERSQLARRKHIFHNVLPHISDTLKGLPHAFA